MADIRFSYSQCLRHAFMSGAGYGDLDKISEEDQQRWVHYDPPVSAGPFKRMNDLVEKCAGDTAIMEQATAKIEEQREEIKRLKATLVELRDHADLSYSVRQAIIKEALR
jgi:hypothetical protein